MKTRFLSVLAILIISVLTFASCNIVKDKTYDATNVDCFNFAERDDGTYEISLKEGAELPAKVQLPVSHNGVEVTAVADAGFKGNAVITELTVPVGYELIGEEAFAFCPNLKAVKIATLGNGTERKLSVRYGAFRECTSLIDLKIGSLVKVIEGYAFYEAKISSLSLTKVESLGVCSFGLCSSLKNVFVPATLVDIHERAFEYSENATFAVADGNAVYKAVDGKLERK